jgi:hypothetical protein
MRHASMLLLAAAVAGPVLGQTSAPADDLESLFAPAPPRPTQMQRWASDLAVLASDSLAAVHENVARSLKYVFLQEDTFYEPPPPPLKLAELRKSFPAFSELQLIKAGRPRRGRLRSSSCRSRRIRMSSCRCGSQRCPR